MTNDELPLFGALTESPHKALRKSGLPRDLKPLAERLRPAVWEEFQGLEAIDQPLVKQLKIGAGRPPSMILWGPPGTGKTTFAKLVGKTYRYPFVELSAVLGGVKELRDIVAAARASSLPNILFMDEIHRFNKAQQDALLPHVEEGTLILIGATTENPSFYLNGALLSRCKVVVFGSLSSQALSKIVARAAVEKELKFEPQAEQLIIELASGDARQVLNLIDTLSQNFNQTGESKDAITKERLLSFVGDSKILFHDRSGEEHYNVVSAFIKSLRGSDADAALYWGFRMIEAGEDPRFVVRRMIIFASEDVGNADPQALSVAVATADAFDRVGLPEGKIPIAQCITYLATAPKSNRSYIAMHAALAAVQDHSKVNVPLHLRNAPTGLMKGLGYGAEYQYPHNFKDARVEGVQYLPDELRDAVFYKPSEIGFEGTLKQGFKERSK